MCGFFGISDKDLIDWNRVDLEDVNETVEVEEVEDDEDENDPEQ